MELDYPQLSEEQINNLKKVIIPKLKEEDINDADELEDAESDGFEWMELFEDYIEPDNLSHITNKELGLDENATPEDRDKVFGVFGASSEWTMVTTLVWEWLETESWE